MYEKMYECSKRTGAKEYSLPFEQDGRKIIKIGANVSPQTRNVEKWIIEE